MPTSASEIFLWLFIINLGIAFGAGLYETRIILPLWFSRSQNGKYSVNLKAMNEIETGRKFWGLVTTMPLTLLTIINLIYAFRSLGTRHDWWLAASLIVFLERILTFSYFIPTAIKLMKTDPIHQSNVSDTVSMWVRFNYFRNFLTILGLLLAMKVLSIPVFIHYQ